VPFSPVEKTAVKGNKRQPIWSMTAVCLFRRAAILPNLDGMPSWTVNAPIEGFVRSRPMLVLDRENPLPVVVERFARLGIQDGENFKVWGGWACIGVSELVDHELIRNGLFHKRPTKPAEPGATGAMARRRDRVKMPQAARITPAHRSTARN
jgi:hypothetical protein